MSEAVLCVENLSKKYKLYNKPYDRLIEWLTAGNCPKHEEVWALRDISFSLKKGEAIGIIGHNGAGKSTLLKILSKALWPTDGKFEVKGNMVSLLELGTGFHPELTGKDNIFNSGRLLGFSNEFIEKKLPDIIEFAELGEYINHPVKTYSSGMYVRLAFSLFANLEPDIYIVDEALSVGDIFFQQKCFRFLQQLKERGTAIIIVSHDMQTVLKYCDRVFILQDGMFKYQGNAIDMVNLYYALFSGSGNNCVGVDDVYLANNNQETFSLKGTNNILSAKGVRRGDKKVEIIGARFVDNVGGEIQTTKTGSWCALEIYAHAKCDIDDLSLGFQFTDRMNAVVFGQTSYMMTRKKIVANQDHYLKAVFKINMDLFEGLYTVAVAATDCQLEISNKIYDWIEGCLLLEVTKPAWRLFHGVANLHTEFDLTIENRRAK